MHKKFDAGAIEKKWQGVWREQKIYRTPETGDKPKTFVLDMFPYPSGEGLHVGHPKGYIATDIYSRFKRMTGRAVLHPMGWDAFGLPAENFAIKHKVHPRVAVEKNIARFKEQLELIGLDYDWEREINTTDPAYYKWTQWIFTKLLKHNLAYQSYEPINWCPGCQTGLANEDLESNGTCERCGSVVEKRPMRQWVLKIRAYADRMLEDLNTLTWPEHIKEAQRNWIGRSEGAEIDFKLSTGEVVTVFTTRADTLFGATFLVLAPEHPLIEKYIEDIENKKEVRDYVVTTKQKAEQDRLDATKEKTGVRLVGITAINPANGEAIPVFIADYVLATYGTGAIMGVPAHDERDFQFARTFGLPVRTVVSSRAITHTGALLELAECPGTYLFQLRSDDAPKAPGMIAFFGGSLEADETPYEALVRELQEELELDITKLKRHIDLVIPEVELPDRQCLVHLYRSIDENALKCHEGSIIVLTAEEAIAGPRTMGHVRAFLEQLTHGHTATVSNGTLIQSGEFDGLTSADAKVAILNKVGGRVTSTYKIRDWVFSRQRYWGEPIPVVHTETGDVYPIAPEQLPVTLPEVEHYEPTGSGESPLSTIHDWVNVTGYITDDNDFVVTSEAPAEKTLIKAKRETNTMPQWAGSSWYYLRFIDPNNQNELISKEKEKHWAPVDVYVGGDHAVRHLIYARFWHKFLYDIDVVSTIEPFQRLEFLGFILAEDGRKMSKRWGNVINPDDIIKVVGADALRVYEMFMGPFENTIAWSKDGLAGACRFLERVNGLSAHIQDSETGDTTSTLHKTVKKVRSDIEEFKFNTAVSAMMIYLNAAEKDGLTTNSFDTFLRLLAPFAPHLTEELWHERGYTTSIHIESFPEYDETLTVATQVTLGVQINGKMRGTITLPPDASEAEALAAALATDTIQGRIGTAGPTKVIYVPGKILNLIVPH